MFGRMIFDIVPGRQKDDLVRKIGRFLDAVGDEDDGLLLVSQQLEQLFLKLSARLLVDRRKRLIHQDNVGIDGQRASKPDPLAHTARELVRVTRLETPSIPQLVSGNVKISSLRSQ